MSLHLDELFTLGGCSRPNIEFLGLLTLRFFCIYLVVCAIAGWLAGLVSPAVLASNSISSRLVGISPTLPYASTNFSKASTPVNLASLSTLVTTTQFPGAVGSSVTLQGSSQTRNVTAMAGAFPVTSGRVTPTPSVTLTSGVFSNTFGLSSSPDFLSSVNDSILPHVVTSSMEFTTTTMVPQICPTNSPGVGNTPSHTSGGAATIMQSSLFLTVELPVKVCLFDVQLFLAEFLCVYTQFDPGNVAIQSIPNSPMEIQIYLQNSELNENFVENLFQVWQNNSRRNEVFSAQTREKV